MSFTLADLPMGTHDLGQYIFNRQHQLRNRKLWCSVASGWMPSSYRADRLRPGDGCIQDWLDARLRELIEGIPKEPEVDLEPFIRLASTASLSELRTAIGGIHATANT